MVRYLLMQSICQTVWNAICYSKNYSCEFGTSFAYKRNPYVSIVSCGLASRFRWWFGRVHCRGPCQHQTLAFTGDIFSVAYRIHQSTLDLAWWSHDHVYTSLFCAHWRPEHVGIDVDFTCRGGAAKNIEAKKNQRNKPKHQTVALFIGQSKLSFAYSLASKHAKHSQAMTVKAILQLLHTWHDFCY